MDINGLTTKQVIERVKQGSVNHTSKNNRNTYSKITLRNSLTIFNFVNLILALMIISVGSYKNLLFIFVAIFNTLISIINEIRAKRIVNKMKLITEKEPTVIRDGIIRQIPQNEIVLDDLLIYSLGDQIIVDSTIKQGTVEVNESSITGEQDNILKKPGDKLISGSFIVSGTCKAVATAVGEDNFINKLEKNAHTIKTADSKLFVIMNKIVKYISFALIPIGILLLWARFRVNNTTTEVAVTSTVAALINMIPEGLILLTSSVLALATIRLARKKVLVQDLYSVETLARIDTIAIDKTGTLTTGNMNVKDVILPDGTIITDFKNKKISTLDVLEQIVSHIPIDNSTSKALAKVFFKKSKSNPKEVIVIPFSSDRKYSGIKIGNNEYLIGAVEFLTDNTKIIQEAKKYKGTYRLLAIVRRNKNNVTLLGFVRLEDEIRSTAKKIIQYFYENEITPVVISGDDVETVTEIAKKVGIKNPKSYDFSSSKDHNYDRIAKQFSIFGRVTPSEKRLLIKALKKQGRTIAMTGDGVNDILAMKEADVSLAIGDGSDAARRSAKLILLNSDFSAVPSIIDEGRQSINNLERSTTLFISKTVYASILAVLFTIIPLEYPYTPIEMSLLNLACIGLPGLILALEPNTKRVSNQFTNNIKKYSIPIGISISVSMLILSIVAKINDFSRPEVLTASLFITSIIDLLLITLISRPFNFLRGALLSTIITIIVLAFLITPIRNLLELTYLPENSLIATILITLFGLFLFFTLKKLIHIVKKRKI